MKRDEFIKNLFTGAGGIFFSSGIIASLASSCTNQVLDLKPEDQLTTANYFKTPDEFKDAANNFYNKMISWQSIDGSSIYDFMDMGADISSDISIGEINYARGSITIPETDNYWNNPYAYIRANNILLQEAAVYKGNKNGIKQYVAEAKFFRAWQHFFLLQRFGGVPIVTTVLDVNSPELSGPRNSRYEVVNQILTDLSDAIPDLPQEQLIPASDKGRISSWAAEAFKARVLLYEATWEKYVKDTTDGDGSSKGSGTTKPDNYPSISEMLTEAISLAKDVMDNGGYELWNYNSVLNNQSYYFLFCLEDAGSNPAGLDKTTNKEFIIQSIYDYNLRKGGINLTHTVTGYMLPSRKMIDMYLCVDGLPVSKSSVFKGYHHVPDEYQNRDYRMLGYVGEAPASGSITLKNESAGYGNRKFAAYNYPVYRDDNTESQNYPQLRLAEVYLMYAEALFELNGSISDADLNVSINIIRARAGVAPLTNSLVSANGLDMLTEIRRERTLELYGEHNDRFNSLKRWGIAEQELNTNTLGMVVGGASYPTEFRGANGNATSLYQPSTYVYGEALAATGAGNLECVEVDAASTHNFKRQHYLYPLPMQQMNLNPKLLQNPGY